MADIFISYKRDERGACERIAEKLRALGLDVWFDARLTAGDSFTAEIEREIKRAKSVLVLWSPESTSSRWVRNEADIGRERGVLCAVQIKPCDIPIEFRDIHFEIIHEPDFNDAHPGWQKLLQRIGQLTGRGDLAGYARALIEAGRPLAAWADSNPKDPLAGNAAGLVMALAGAKKATIVRRGLGAFSAVLLALLAAGAAGVAAWTVKPAPPLPTPPPLTARQVALDLVGRWNEVGLGKCDDNTLSVSLEPGGIAFNSDEKREGRALLSVEDGWLKLSDGVLMRRAGANMKLKATKDAPEAEFTPCA